METIVTFILILIGVFYLIVIFHPVFSFRTNSKNPENKEIDKTTYVKDALTLYYVNGTNEVFFYHKGCWYLKSEGSERSKYKPCGLDMSFWLDNELASIELIDKNKEFKPKGL